MESTDAVLIGLEPRRGRDASIESGVKTDELFLKVSVPFEKLETFLSIFSEGISPSAKADSSGGGSTALLADLAN